MPGTATGKKLDLSRLTDEEAKHVWDVVQRDFDLRKKEEDRLGDLKTKIEKEDTKTELLGNQTSLTESYCIRCLQPFKFLVNSRRQCLDCHHYICKSCSRYNKKEHGSVCDPCHMARVLKIGTLEWYHENVRTRFKRFGSAKVMRSLFKRLSGEHSGSQSDYGADGYEEHSMDATDSQNYKRIKKSKRRLTVDPIDFQLGCDYSESRGRSNQAPGSHDVLVMDVDGGELNLAEADMASVFHQMSEQQRAGEESPDDVSLVDDLVFPSRSVSRLSHTSRGSGSGGGPQGSGSYLAGPDDSGEEEDEEHCRPYLLYQSHLGPCSHTSQESLTSALPPPQISELNRHISNIESILSRLEQKVTSTYDQASLTPSSSSPLPQWEGVDQEEQQLRQKLHDMTHNISDHSLTSDEDEDESNGPHSSQQEVPAWRSPEGDSKPSRLPTRPSSRASTVDSILEEEPQQTDSQKTNHMTDSVERKWLPLEEGSESSFRGSTALLVELEGQVAQAAADVQNAQSEVSYIENRIAALNAAGMPVDKKRRSAIPIHPRRLSHHVPSSKNHCCLSPGQVDRFVRNSLYRGSLTQRNAVAKPKTGASCAKPVMTQGS
ncbi:melanophilin [Limanda limanda]|uniref:melanophilin n=1 Tax=Limanda limanda TaxID=27771 RepID=UPI0029C8513A|nr:melanophilin [Limanda limanda]